MSNNINSTPTPTPTPKYTIAGTGTGQNWWPYSIHYIEVTHAQNKSSIFRYCTFKATDSNNNEIRKVKIEPNDVLGGFHTFFYKNVLVPWIGQTADQTINDIITNTHVSIINSAINGPIYPHHDGAFEHIVTKKGIDIDIPELFEIRIG